ncbi:sulfatase [Halobacteriales archaeon QH_2_65_14]|nr:MAG: sulfatase [Halobacteriales archaeon QH_2_65_14]
MSDSKPNILLVHAHDLGRYLGCYGRDVDTPNFDELATEGVLFENHYVTAPQCSPSRGSLLTGVHPHVNGLMGLAHSAWSLDDAWTTLPQHLDAAGYETHMFGLQHVTDDPRGIGFEYVHSEGTLRPVSSPEIHEVNRAADVAMTFETFLEAGSYHEPFFASVGVFELHRTEINDHFGFDDGRYDPPDPADVTVPSYLPDRPGIRADLAGMEGMLESLDDALGRMLDALHAAGLEGNTLVIFTTEHGIAFPRAKGCCYDPGIEAALLMRLPGVIDGGVRYDELLSNVDVMPTILDLVGGAKPDIAGRSFLPLLTGDEYAPRERVFAEMTWHDRYNPVRAIRTGRYKYIRNFWHLPSVYLSNDILVSRAGRELREQYHADHRPFEELYDLEADPDEEINLIGVENYEAIRTDLEAELVDWMRRTDDPLLDGPVAPADYDAIVPWERMDSDNQPRR